MVKSAKTEAAAATAAATEAINKHVALKHTDRLSWGIDTIDVELLLDENRHVVGVRQLTDTAVVSISNSPFQNDLGQAHFRGWAFRQKKGGTPEEKTSIAALPMIMIFDRGRAPIETPVGGISPLAEGLQRVLSGPISPDLEAIEIAGFVKFLDEDGKLDAQPTIQIENRLKLKIKQTPAKCEPAVPTATDAPSFDDVTPVSAVEDDTSARPATFVPTEEVRPVLTATRPTRQADSRKWTGRAPSVGSSPTR